MNTHTKLPNGTERGTQEHQGMVRGRIGGSRRWRNRTGRGRAARPLVWAVCAFLLVGCDTSGLLDVDLPGRVTEDALSNPALASTLVASVVNDVECAWDNFVAAATHHSDEWIQSSGNATMRRWGLRDITPTFAAYVQGSCTTSYGLFTPLHIARVQAESHFDRISGFSQDEVPRRTEFLATIRAYGAFPLVAFGEAFCETPLDGGDQIMTPTDLLELAESRFTEALQLAEQAGLPEIRHLALVGRARARLGLEDYAGVIADAELVPEGFIFHATRDESPARRQNRHYSSIAGGEGDPESRKHATVAPSYRGVTWKGEPDPRVNTRFDGGLGFDFATAHWTHDKVPQGFSTPVRMASWEEAQLFIAEAAAITGDLDRARSILDGFHSRAGIPPVTADDIPTQDDVIAHVIEERRRELFVEGGHRLRDHLRWRGTRFEIPFLGEPGSDHPNGVDDQGQPYESATCFPLPDIEVVGG
jgi:starch-binding outer membrane protein, SusD/RagB family